MLTDYFKLKKCYLDKLSFLEIKICKIFQPICRTTYKIYLEIIIN